MFTNHYSCTKRGPISLLLPSDSCSLHPVHTSNQVDPGSQNKSNDVIQFGKFQLEYQLHARRTEVDAQAFNYVRQTHAALDCFAQ